jgi:hypothetical protein
MKRMQVQKVTALLLGCVLYAATLPALAQARDTQRTFDSPEAAVQALLAAAKSPDETQLMGIFGAKHRNVVATADKAQDRERLERFVRAAEEYQLLRAQNDGRITLVVGADAWPLPIPLVKSGGVWRFDTAAGEEEIVNRRIGANELAAIEALTFYGNAQRQYASKPRDNTNVRQFAQRLASTPGKKDGLYWDVDASKEEESSPLGPLIRDATSRKSGEPYNGYYYRVLKGQGSVAPGGRYSYVINGRMVAGYALIAYPAEYRNSGVKTFIVNHYGIVYEKDLGPKTAQIAASISDYSPDRTWASVAD